jgi:hypothetical protein
LVLTTSGPGDAIRRPRNLDGFVVACASFVRLPNCLLGSKVLDLYGEDAP